MRTLLYLLPGLGDALTAGPVLDGVARAGERVDVLTMLEPVAQYAAALPMVDRVEYFDLAAGQLAAFAAARKLRRRRYDLAILPFPATRWQYQALAAAVGACKLVVHRYSGTSDVFAKMQNATLVPLLGGHRIAENQRLARNAGFEGRACYVVPPQWRGKVQRGLLAVHTGTMRYKGNERKKWPLESFVALIGRCIAAGRRIRVFIGPSDDEDETALSGLLDSPAVEVVRTDLASAARSLSECEVFVGNDAGLAHLSAALGVKTVALFGMTDPARLQPLGRALAVRPSDCPPCHDEGMRTFSCVRNFGYRCTRLDLTVEAVFSAIERAFQEQVPDFVPSMTGPFRLYGRARSVR